MTAPKFSKGDRLRVVKDVISGGVVCLKKGDIHTATRTVPGWVSLTPDGGVGEWIEDRFELYAKAGEFVVGDRVRTIYPHATDNRVRTVRELSRCAWMEGGTFHHAISLEGDPMSYRADAFRLATSEEIAAAEAKTVELAHVTAPEQAARLAAMTWETIGDATPHPSHNLEPRLEIPAAEFDFSTIKVGDEIVLRWKVNRNGTDVNGFIRAMQPNGAGDIYVESEGVVAVIPAPKPKTLRERAIEAARSVVDDRDYLEDIVTAVLAEVEKVAI